MKRRKIITDEWCPDCLREYKIPATVHPIPDCPGCGCPLVPCSACVGSGPSARRCTECEDGINFKLHSGLKKACPSYKLATIIKIADKAYRDGDIVTRAGKGEPVYDTLACFIATELGGTFAKDHTKEEQLMEAARVIGIARAQLEDVECAFNERLRKLNNGGVKRTCRKS